jgi:hypothetical protein
MITDAVHVYYTGMLSGVVRDANGQGIGAASVTLGDITETSDTRGHFRVLRLSLQHRLTLRIESPEHGTLTVVDPPISKDARLKGRRTFVLRKGTDAEESVSLPQRPLSEWDGDTLPAAYRSVRERDVAVNELRRGDILIASQFYESSQDVKLVSYLRSYEDGDIIVNAVRLPRSVLPGDTVLSEQFRFNGNGFVRTDMSRLARHRYKLRLRIRRLFAGRPYPSTEEQKKAYISDVLRELTKQAYYWHDHRRPT